MWYQNRRTKHKRDRERENEALPGTRTGLHLNLPAAPPSNLHLPIQNHNHIPQTHTNPHSSIPNSPVPPPTSLSGFFIFPNLSTTSSNTPTTLNQIPTSNTSPISSSNSCFSLRDLKVSVSSSNEENIEKEKGKSVKDFTPITKKQYLADDIARNQSFMAAMNGGVSLTVGKMDIPPPDHETGDRVSKYPFENLMYPSSILGAFHSVPPAMSAFRPLVPRPMHPLHPLSSRPYPGWFS